LFGPSRSIPWGSDHRPLPLHNPAFLCRLFSFWAAKPLYQRSPWLYTRSHLSPPQNFFTLSLSPFMILLPLLCWADVSSPKSRAETSPFLRPSPSTPSPRQWLFSPRHSGTHRSPPLLEEWVLTGESLPPLRRLRCSSLALCQFPPPLLSPFVLLLSAPYGRHRLLPLIFLTLHPPHQLHLANPPASDLILSLPTAPGFSLLG